MKPSLRELIQDFLMEKNMYWDFENYVEEQGYSLEDYDE